jgi:hypothetical protein
MNTKPLTLMEAAQLVKSMSPEESMNNESLNEFTLRVEEFGKDIINSREGTELIEEASTFMLAGVMAEMISNPDPTNLLLFSLIRSRPDIFQLILGYAFVYAVGICVVEELH